MIVADRDPALGTAVVSQILQVSPRTVAKLIDEGRLTGHRIPGSKTRRVLRSSLVAFCEQAHLPPSMLAAAQLAQREYQGRPRKQQGGPTL